MKTRKITFGFLAALLLVAVSCEPNTTAQEDELYEVGIEKKHLRPVGSK